MKRFKFDYTLKRDPECGQEIILARTKKEATEIFNDMVASEPDSLAYQANCCTPHYYEIKVVQVKELDDNS